MSARESVSMKEIAQRYRDSYRGMYYAACAIMGSERAAERALVSAMIDDRGDDMEGLKRHALAELEEARGESFFSCLSGDIDETDELYEWLLMEADDTRRAVMLRYGLHMSVREIALAMDKSAAHVRRMLETVRKAALRRAGNEAEGRIAGICRREIASSPIAPDYGTILRAVENRLKTDGRSLPARRRVRGVVSYLAALVLLLVLGGMLWTSAILLDYYRQTYQQDAETIQTAEPVTEGYNADT